MPAGVQQLQIVVTKGGTRDFDVQGDIGIDDVSVTTEVDMTPRGSPATVTGNYTARQEVNAYSE